MKSSGARSRSCSRRASSGIASTGGTLAALSTSATTSTRPRSAAASRSAGRCDCRAMPPAPMTAPRYRFRSGDAGVRIALAVEQGPERRGVPLVDPEERDQHQAHPHGLRPEERGDVGGDRRHAQQHEADVLAEPRAQRQHHLLARAVLGAERVGYSVTAQQADELHRSWEQVRLPLHVVAVDPRTKALQHGLPAAAVEVLRQVELAPIADADVEESVAHEVDGGALQGVREPGGGDQQKRAGSPEPGVDQPVDEVEVQIDEPEVVADPVQRAAEPGGGAPQAGELAVGRIEDGRDDEQHEPDHIGPAVLVREQVPGHEPDHERPQRHLVRRNPRRLERARDADADGAEEMQVRPLLDRTALMRQIGLRLHRAHPSWWRGRPSPDPRRRSEEHTSELQSQFHLVCRLLLEKKKKNKNDIVLTKKKKKKDTLNKVDEKN